MQLMQLGITTKMFFCVVLVASVIAIFLLMIMWWCYWSQAWYIIQRFPKLSIDRSIKYDSMDINRQNLVYYSSFYIEWNECQFVVAPMQKKKILMISQKLEQLLYNKNNIYCSCVFSFRLCSVVTLFPSLLLSICLCCVHQPVFPFPASFLWRALH